MGPDFFRNAHWLDTRARGYLRLLALLNMIVLGVLLAGSHDGIDRNGFLLGTDFLSFWTAGRMLHAQGAVYDAAAHIVAQRGYFAQSGAYTAFFYPPPFLLACWPLGLVGYFSALALWLGVTGAGFVFAVRQWVGREWSAVRTGLPIWVIVPAFPPVLITITHGQTSFLVAALLGLGALFVRDKPFLAGVLFGLAAIKPQFGLLVPLVLVLTGEWRTVLAATATVAVLALAATAAFGVEIWPGWLAATRAAQAALAGGIVPYAKMQSLFAAAKLLGASTSLAFALQGLLTLAVAAAVCLAARLRGYSTALASAMLTGALLATPFVLDYDMVLLAFPLIHLAAGKFRPWEKLICACAFIAPAFARPLAMEAGIPIMPLVLTGLFVVLWRRAMESPAPDGGRPARGQVRPALLRHGRVGGGGRRRHDGEAPLHRAEADEQDDQGGQQ